MVDYQLLSVKDNEHFYVTLNYENGSFTRVKTIPKLKFYLCGYLFYVHHSYSNREYLTVSEATTGHNALRNEEHSDVVLLMKAFKKYMQQINVSKQLIAKAIQKTSTPSLPCYAFLR